MSPIALALSLPVALIGAYYLVNAGTVAPLGVLEGERANQVRVRLRRVNGIVMILMGVALYLAISRTFALEPGQRPGAVALLAWIATLPLVVAMLVLAWLDMRLTRKLKRDLLRRAAMNDRNRPTTPSSANHRGGTSALVAAALLISGGSVACNDSAGQGPASTQPATTRPTTRPADEPRQAADEPQRLRTVEMEIGSRSFVLQVADRPETRELGLMFRRSLLPDEGMIFVFPDERELSFWMKNTYIPLDILYLDARGRILNIEQMAAHDLRSWPSAGPAKYAIELPLGTAEELGLRRGTVLEIPEGARDARE